MYYYFCLGDVVVKTGMFWVSSLVPAVIDLFSLTTDPLV